ncbi:MAG: lysostaphin resistance A-like protein, partial [Paracoccaceae bacterium]
MHHSTSLDAYLAPARTQPGAWRFVLGFIITIGVYVIGMILVVLGWVLLRWLMLGDANLALESMGGLAVPGSRAGIIVTLLSFVGIWVGLAIALRVMHGQSFWTLFDPGRRIQWRDLGRGILLALVFSCVSLAIASMFVGLPTQAQDIGSWAVLLVPLMACVFLQATAEELLFRGYLLQQLGTRFGSVIAWALIPSLLFGMMHFWNAEGAAAYYYVGITGITGL